ncbi:MAG TPA: putative metal-dependent hydrolase [Candidatus Angelobacter sp.]|nr:putative metal-dependent hydrolase [Candidatus Angelobacter sp.]
MSDPRYPIGRFSPDAQPTPATRARHIDAIAGLPQRMRQAVAGLNDNQLDTPYREGGWTVRKVIHHVPDSHLNAYIRFKWAMTEDGPTIKAYDETAWAELKDSQLTPVDVSLDLLESLHSRWSVLLRSMQAEDFGRRFVHPDSGPHDVDWLLSLYSWHGDHHLAHITSLRERMGW